MKKIKKNENKFQLKRKHLNQLKELDVRVKKREIEINELNIRVRKLLRKLELRINNENTNEKTQ